MERGVEHLLNRHSGGLALDPGLRKTSITLAAFKLLKARGTVKRMLVIAPLRPLRKTWRQEGAKWSDFRDLKFAFLHGPKKEAALASDVDIYLINPEGLPWLCRKFLGRSLPFDIVCIDELTRFKNSQSDRVKTVRPRLAKVAWRWGLTGSIAPNGYMDLFGQMLMLDDGAALGRYVTHYRDQFFSLGFDGFTYDLLPGAEKRIIERLAPYWLQMSADDYLELPELVTDERMIEMEPEARKTYRKMKADMVAQLPEGTITAANSAAVYSKLSQMANGAVYFDMPGGRKVAHVHDAKLDALEELVEELNGQPLLVAYEFNHDLDRIIERFGVADPVTGKKKLPYLGKGTTPKQEDEWIDAWNRNEIPIFPCHPASAGHGLNLQEGNAGHIAQFGITWDLELWDQFLRRIRRSGNTAQRVVNHLLIVADTIDELKLEALQDKDLTQRRLLKALNDEISRDAKARAGGAQPVLDDRRLPMVARLGRQDTAPAATAAAPQPETAAAPIKAKGWGQSAGVTHAPAAEPQADEGQRERVSAAIQPAGFSKPVGEQMEQLRNGDYGAVDGQAEPPAPVQAKTRTRRAAAPEPAVAGEPWLDPVKGEILKVAFADPATTLEEGLEVAGLLLQWARKS
jgi:SNF2 family DNA or RNA helicase